MSRPASPGAEAKNISLRFAQSVDVEPLARLINAAFIVQEPFIEGDRIDHRGVRAYLEKGKFLVAEDSHGLAGCVYLELRGERGYLGLLGVVPRRQGTGLGRKLMEACETYFRGVNCRAMDLLSIIPRMPLRGFYAHL